MNQNNIKSFHQCITVRQRAARYPFVHYSALFLCTFSIFHSGNLYFFMLHSFHVALFSYCTISMLHFYAVIFPCCTFFSSCSLFIYCTISCCAFIRCNVFVLHSSPVALFACCNFFLLYFVHVALFPEV